MTAGRAEDPCGTPRRIPLTPVRTVRSPPATPAFQQWQALLTNRNKRQRAGEFLVQGVRPITLAVEHGWHTAALLHAAGRRLSDGPATCWTPGPPGTRRHAPELLAELGGKDASRN